MDSWTLKVGVGGGGFISGIQTNRVHGICGRVTLPDKDAPQEHKESSGAVAPSRAPGHGAWGSCRTRRLLVTML